MKKRRRRRKKRRPFLMSELIKYLLTFVFNFSCI